MESCGSFVNTPVSTGIVVTRYIWGREQKLKLVYASKRLFSMHCFGWFCERNIATVFSWSNIFVKKFTKFENYFSQFLGSSSFVSLSLAFIPE